MKEEKAEKPKKSAPSKGAYQAEHVAKEGEKKHEKSTREGPKPYKGVSAEAHPLDRRSGTGRG